MRAARVRSPAAVATPTAGKPYAYNKLAPPREIKSEVVMCVIATYQNREPHNETIPREKWKIITTTTCEGPSKDDVSIRYQESGPLPPHLSATRPKWSHTLSLKPRLPILRRQLFPTPFPLPLAEVIFGWPLITDLKKMKFFFTNFFRQFKFEMFKIREFTYTWLNLSGHW